MSDSTNTNQSVCPHDVRHKYMTIDGGSFGTCILCGVTFQNGDPVSPKPPHIVTNLQKFLDEYLGNVDYDYRDSCGAHNCECYNNSIKIDALIKYLESKLS